jgi:mRNA interferase HigB
MDIIGASILDECERKHADVRGSLHAWREDVERADWKTPLDIKRCYVTASVVSGTRFVFNVKGNSYRLVVEINFEIGLVQILFAGTHEEYNKIDVAKL